MTSTLSRRGLLAAAARRARAGGARAARPMPCRPGRARPIEAAMARSGRPSPDRRAVRRHPGAQAGGDEAHRGVPEGAPRHAPIPRVMAAFEAVPREYFHYLYDQHRATPGDAYEDNPKPWALGYGSALSDYLGQAYMTQVCQPKPERRDAGDRHRQRLPERAAVAHRRAGLFDRDHRAAGPARSARSSRRSATTTSHTRVGDGYYGWPEVEGGFDIIIVTCAAQYAPPDLFKQLKPGGRMIIPIGQPFKRGQVLYVYTKDAEGKIHSRARCRRVLHPDDRGDDEAAGGCGDGLRTADWGQGRGHSALAAAWPAAQTSHLTVPGTSGPVLTGEKRTWAGNGRRCWPAPC